MELVVVDELVVRLDVGLVVGVVLVVRAGVVVGVVAPSAV